MLVHKVEAYHNIVLLTCLKHLKFKLRSFLVRLKDLEVLFCPHFVRLRHYHARARVIAFLAVKDEWLLLLLFLVRLLAIRIGYSVYLHTSTSGARRGGAVLISSFKFILVVVAIKIDLMLADGSALARSCGTRWTFDDSLAHSCLPGTEIFFYYVLICNHFCDGLSEQLGSVLLLNLGREQLIEAHFPGWRSRR